MPRYDYRCRTCGATFELNRPMSQANAPTLCPKGHDDVSKLMNLITVGGAASASGEAAPSGGGGGCCGGACGC